MGDKYVAKIAKKPTSSDRCLVGVEVTSLTLARYFEDVKMQMLCADLGNQFNMLGTPKKIEFLYAWVLEIPRSPAVFYGLEVFMGTPTDFVE